MFCRLTFIVKAGNPKGIHSYADIAKDPKETTNLADAQPETVKKLQGRIQQLGEESAKSLFMQATFGAYMKRELGTPALPSDPAFFEQGD